MIRQDKLVQMLEHVLRRPLSLRMQHICTKARLIPNGEIVQVPTLHVILGSRVEIWRATDGAAWGVGVQGSGMSQHLRMLLVALEAGCLRFSTGRQPRRCPVIAGKKLLEKEYNFL